MSEFTNEFDNIGSSAFGYSAGGEFDADFGAPPGDGDFGYVPASPPAEGNKVEFVAFDALTDEQDVFVAPTGTAEGYVPPSFEMSGSEPPGGIVKVEETTTTAAPPGSASIGTGSGGSRRQSPPYVSTRSTSPNKAEKSSALREWEIEHEKELEAKRKAEIADMEEQARLAATELSSWFERHRSEVELRKAQNREEEIAKKAAVRGENSGSRDSEDVLALWKRVHLTVSAPSSLQSASPTNNNASGNAEFGASGKYQKSSGASSKSPALKPSAQTDRMKAVIAALAAEAS